MNEHIGSTLDDFLAEEELHAEAEAIAIKRVVAFQLEQRMTSSSLPRRSWHAVWVPADRPWIACWIRTMHP